MLFIHNVQVITHSSIHLLLLRTYFRIMKHFTNICDEHLVYTILGMCRNFSTQFILLDMYGFFII